MTEHEYGPGEYWYEIGQPGTGGSIWCELVFRGPQHHSWRVRITGYKESFPSIVIYDAAGHCTCVRRGYRLAEQARDVILGLLPFLQAEAESYRRCMGAAPPADGWIFNAEVAQWCYLNDSELDCLRQHLASGRTPRPAHNNLHLP